jgi:phage tail sheath gpL-like
MGSIPSNLRIPFTAVAFDPSQATAGPAVLPWQALLIGQKLSTGAATADTVVRCTSVADAIAAGGRGSMLQDMAVGWFAINPFIPLQLGVLADNGAGAQATGSIAVTGPATETRPIAFYFGGTRIEVAVNSGDAATAIATNITAAITAAADLPITAATVSASSNLTFRHKGPSGNAFDVRHSFLPGEKLPAGVGITITAMSGGTTPPTLTNLFASIASIWFQIWAHPYTDSTTLGVIETELASRLGPMRSIDGVAITSANGNSSTLATLGTARNSPSSCITAQTGASPLTPPWRFAAETAALAASSASDDPAQPFNTLAYANAMATAPTDQFDAVTRNTLLFDGIATSKLGPGGVVQMERLITTYQLNPSGQPDVAYLDATTMFTLQYLRYTLRSAFLKYARYKLADDGTKFDAGQKVMTPSLGTSVVMTWFTEMEAKGLVEDRAGFKAGLAVVRDPTDRNRLNILVPPNLVNGLDVVATSMQFRL